MVLQGLFLSRLGRKDWCVCCYLYVPKLIQFDDQVGSVAAVGQKGRAWTAYSPNIYPSLAFIQAKVLMSLFQYSSALFYDLHYLSINPT